MKKSPKKRRGPRRKKRKKKERRQGEPPRQKDKPFAVDVELDTICRCGGRVTAGTTPDTLASDGKPAWTLMHSLPQCDEFMNMDALQFLRWIRTGRTHDA